MFLIRASGTRNKAHYWDGKDTACKWWSTGRMNQNRKWEVKNAICGHPMCTACLKAKLEAA